MDLILRQISKSYETRLVCNKMLIVPYIIKCKSIYATIYYSDSKLQCHLYISTTMQCASNFLLAFNRIMLFVCNDSNLNSIFSKLHMDALHKASLHVSRLGTSTKRTLVCNPLWLDYNLMYNLPLIYFSFTIHMVFAL